ncbi:hypothetical protein BH23ACT9_BH23ACT9_11370 [soil metagenome]
MVGVPSALYLAAGLLAVAASVGLACALLQGASGQRPADAPRDRLRLVAVGGALVYATSHALAGAQIGPVEVWTWMHAAGLVGIAIGASPSRMRAASGLPLLIPLTPVIPAYAAAAAGLLAAGRIAAAGRSAMSAAVGITVLAVAHGIAPTQPRYSAIATVVGALVLGSWLWASSSRRILTKLVTAFVSALLAMAILLAAVLATVSSAELTGEELDRLSRLAEQLTADIQAWPGEAVSAASPLARSVGPLLGTALGAAESADLFNLSLASQDFFVTVDSGGVLVNSHPQDLPGSIRLAVAGHPVVTGLREGRSTDTGGGLLSSGDVIVGFGAVAVRSQETRPEDPPAGVLVTGRLLDPVFVAQQSTALDVGLVVVVGGRVAFGTDEVAAAAPEIVSGLDDRAQADLSVSDAALFAAAATISDPGDATTLGRVIATSTPDVIAAVERTQTQRLFLVALFGGALALLVATVVIRRFVRPIAKLTEAAVLVGAGDLRGRADIDSGDEVGVLGAAFDEMVESLQEQQEDLTNSAQREARLRGRLESLTSSMSDGLIAVDTEGLVITFNTAAERLTGHTARGVVGLPLGEVLAGTPLEEGATDPEEGLSTDPLRLTDPLDTSSAAARLMLSRFGGDRVPVAATAAPVRSPNGDIIGRVYVLRDISRDLEVERMKTEFLANVSHELRTPITPIKGYANVLAHRDVPPESTKRFAGQILDSTRRLERIVEMIVDFAGLDSGRVVLRREPIDLRDVVGTTLEQWRDDHDDRVFVSRLNGALPPVFADPTYLRRCLDELLDNAVKFSPDGDPVTVAAMREGSRVRLQVIDAGIGIDAEAARRLFTDFVQADGTETRHFGGLGLGLGLVKRIVDGVGGSVEVQSEPGAGTTFSLVLDVAGPVPVDPLPAPPPPPGSVPPPPA